MFNLTVVLKKTKVDISFNFSHLSTLNLEVEDVELTFEDLYLKLKPPNFETL